ncbi:MAG: nuclear transport factor 2 family protein [Alphaproteobacteria bacterium]|nr:nuclear transport factor 2 family protein [Alphaproteobacteria bacterium]
MSSGGLGEIERVLQDYFDGFYESSVDKLKRVFHPQAHLYSLAEGKLADADMPAVYARTASRTPPKASGQARLDRILAVDQSGPNTALARVELAIGPRLFTDYLSLMRIDGRWQIISKTFTSVPLAEAKRAAAE